KSRHLLHYLFNATVYLTANPSTSASVSVWFSNFSSHDGCAPALTAALTMISRRALLSSVNSVSTCKDGLEKFSLIFSFMFDGVPALSPTRLTRTIFISIPVLLVDCLVSLLFRFTSLANKHSRCIQCQTRSSKVRSCSGVNEPFPTKQML